jgi:hypothetical protein
MIINTSRDLETDWRELEADRAGIFGWCQRVSRSHAKGKSLTIAENSASVAAIVTRVPISQAL